MRAEESVDTMAIGRKTNDLPTTLSWVGPGRTAFAGAAGQERLKELREVHSFEDLTHLFGGGGDPAFSRSLRAYFAAGGGPCWVLNLPSLRGLPEQHVLSSWLGEDGGLGMRTGIKSLYDVEDVGTIAVVGVPDGHLRQRLVSELQGRDDIFVVLDSLPDETTGDLPAADRVAVIRGWTRDEEGLQVPPSGRALALMEASDFREDRPALVSAKNEDHPCLSSLSPGPSSRLRPGTIRNWRFWEGLRRSIERGTRWVVFEQQGELLRRRVEREVGAFLARLHRLGLIGGRTLEDAFRVRCGSGASAGEGGPEGRLVLTIDVRRRHGSMVHLGDGRGEGIEAGTGMGNGLSARVHTEERK